MNSLPKQDAVTPHEDSNTRFIPLTQGQFAIVDTADYEWLNQWKWHAQWSPLARCFLVARKISKRGPNVLMHRLILGLERGDHRQGDHINFNMLDNRRRNLRVCTRRQNVLHRRRNVDNASGFKGVMRVRRKWRATITVNYKQIHLGYFYSPEDAARAYDVAAAKYYGEFAELNFRK